MAYKKSLRTNDIKWVDDSVDRNVINVGTEERIISVIAGTVFFRSGIGNLFRSPISSLIKTGLGAYLFYRGASGNCLLYSKLGKTKDVVHTPSVNIRLQFDVNQARAVVYKFWRNLENLPLFMKHLVSVKEIDDSHSEWEAEIPGNMGRLKWNAEIVKEEYGTLLGWQSTENSVIENAGKVEFYDIPGGGTQLNVVITYRPPAGYIGVNIARLFNPVVETMIRDEVLGFKEYIERQNQEGTPLEKMTD